MGQKEETISRKTDRHKGKVYTRAPTRARKHSHARTHAHPPTHIHNTHIHNTGHKTDTSTHSFRNIQHHHSYPIYHSLSFNAKITIVF